MNQSYFKSVLTPFQKIVYAILIGMWLSGLIMFWEWWFSTEHLVSWLGLFLTSILLLWVTALPGYFFFFAYRAKRPDPFLTLGDGEEPYYPQGLGTETEECAMPYPVTIAHQAKRFAAVVTHAPSEGAEILIKTLDALVHIRNTYYPKMEVWVATEDMGEKLGQTDMILAYCEENNIGISCRKGQEDYHNKSFPRRTRCKEGNLSWFYEQYVFFQNRYEYALQFDVDHVPTPGYVSAILAAFDDPEVGYVSAPSICTANADQSFWVMPRAIVEAALHGVLQAGYNGGWAPNPIGSHYAVRIKALELLIHPIRKGFWSRKYTKHQGGVGPELAEDHTTGLASQANGWKGIHAFDAVAYGDGPGSFLDAMVQEQQWSRSLMQVLLMWTSGYMKLGKMKFHIKAEYLFSQMWYPLFGLQMFVGMLLPIVALWSKTVWVNVDYIGFLAYSLLITFLCMLPVAWLKHCKTFRPISVPVMSLQTLMFQLVRWPWAFLGVLEGFIGSVILNRELNFKVTPKGVTGAQKLPLKAIAPYIMIIVANLATAMLVNDPGPSKGYYYFTLLSGVTYLIVVLAIIMIHLKENRKLEGYSLKIAWQPIAVTLMLIVFCAFAIVDKGPVAYSVILGTYQNQEEIDEPVIQPWQIAGDTGNGG